MERLDAQNFPRKKEFFYLVVYSQRLASIVKQLGIGIIFGLGYGGSSTLQPLVVVEFFGLSAMGVLLGNFIFSICIGGSLGPFLTGVLYDASGSYRLALAICAATALAGLVLALGLTRPEKKP